MNLLIDTKLYTKLQIWKSLNNRITRDTALKYFYDYFLTNWSFKIRIKTDIKKSVNDYSRLDIQE